jgi:hypothetical protein
VARRSRIISTWPSVSLGLPVTVLPGLREPLPQHLWGRTCRCGTAPASWGGVPRGPVYPRPSAFGESGSEGTCSLDPDLFYGAQFSGPLFEQFAVVCHVRCHAQGPKMPAEPIESDGDMGILVGVYSQSDLHFDARTVSHLHTCFPPQFEQQQLLAAEPRQGGHNCDRTFLVEGFLL